MNVIKNCDKYDLFAIDFRTNLCISDTQTYSSIQEDSFVSEAISTAKDDSIKKSVTETPQTELAISAESSPEEVKGVSAERAAKYKTSLGRSASESSIPEEVLSQSSIEDATVTPNRK